MHESNIYIFLTYIGKILHKMSSLILWISMIVTFLITAHLQLIIVMICLMLRNQEIMFHLRHHLVMIIFWLPIDRQDQCPWVRFVIMKFLSWSSLGWSRYLWWYTWWIYITTYVAWTRRFHEWCYLYWKRHIIQFKEAVAKSS